jgi:NIPSNAP protein
MPRSCANEVARWRAGCHNRNLMKRRDFLKSSVAIAGAAAATTELLAAEESGRPAAREFYELRTYHLRRGPMQKRFDDFYREAAIPAMNRAGISPVGVFSVATGPDSPTMYVLLPHKSAEAFAGANERVRADADYQKAGADFINAPATDPSYVRVESSLLLAFEGMPKIEVPTSEAMKKGRLFELRTYESHSKKANSKKVEMFNKGEIAVFRRTGLAPVFFGETLIGPKMPNLIYMLVFENMAAHDKNWGQFGSDPEWRKLSTTPGYTDAEIVSNISNAFLRPTAYSQV